MRYLQNEVNLHTHSFYCRHGEGRIIDYVDEAGKKGLLKVLGFSEHAPLPDKNLSYGTRMLYSELDQYERDVKEADGRNGIKTLLGAECDWLKDEAGFYKDELLGERGYSYLLGSVHSMISPVTGQDTYISRIGPSFRSILPGYVKLYTEMLSSGLFLYGCHPDLYMSDYRSWDNNAKAAARDIGECARDCGVPLEMNDCGIRKGLVDTDDGKKYRYTNKEFWIMMKEMGVKIVTGSDAHEPEDVQGYETEGFSSQTMKMADEIGIEFMEWEIDGKSVSCVKKEG